MRASTRHLLVTLLLIVGSGASCPRGRQIVNDYAPVVLPPDASLEDVIRIVNANSARIEQLQSVGATLTGEGMPKLDASYAYERPRRFRLRAQTSFGTELDLGSNEQTYWMWVKRSDEPAVYWGRHEEFYQSSAREMVPVPPDWLIEALGVVELDPTGQHEGPFRHRPGQLEVRTQVPTANGNLTKITVLDDARGWVVEQHVFDASGQPLASALAAGFQFDQTSGVSLPRLVEIRLPPAGLQFTLQTERHQINQLVGDPEQLWTMPQISGVPLVDLSSPSRLGARSVNPAMATRSSRYAQRPLRNAGDPAIRRLPPFDRLR